MPLPHNRELTLEHGVHHCIAFSVVVVTAVHAFPLLTHPQRAFGVGVAAVTSQRLCDDPNKGKVSLLILEARPLRDDCGEAVLVYAAAATIAEVWSKLKTVMDSKQTSLQLLTESHKIETYAVIIDGRQVVLPVVQIC